CLTAGPNQPEHKKTDTPKLARAERKASESTIIPRITSRPTMFIFVLFLTPPSVFSIDTCWQGQFY
ncbi:hypothetical protein, partial [Pseudomonas savastanoi]